MAQKTVTRTLEGEEKKEGKLAVVRADSLSIEEKRKRAEAARAELNKEYGANTVTQMSADGDKSYPKISTGSISLDIALGIGGIPRGRIIEIYGPESSGKTTLTLHIVAEAQRMGGLAAFIDAEHALDPDYARKLGVKVDEMDVSQPDNGEQALEIAERLIRSSAYDVIIIDSVAALTPKAEIEGDMGQATMGLHARLMSQGCRKLVAAIAKSGTTVIFINQIRMKIGVMFGSPETTTGGNALKFYASVRMDIRKIETEFVGGKKDGEAVANSVRVKVVKNKMAPPFRKAEFDIVFNKGIDKARDYLDLAVQFGIVEKSGTWFSYKDNRIAQGAKAAVEYLDANPQFFNEIISRVREEAGIDVAEDASKLAAAAADIEKNQKRSGIEAVVKAEQAQQQAAAEKTGRRKRAQAEEGDEPHGDEE